MHVLFSERINQLINMNVNKHSYTVPIKTFNLIKNILFRNNRKLKTDHL